MMIQYYITQILQYVDILISKFYNNTYCCVSIPLPGCLTVCGAAAPGPAGEAYWGGGPGCVAAAAEAASQPAPAFCSRRVRLAARLV